MKKFITSIFLFLVIFPTAYSQIGLDLRKYNFSDIPTLTPEEDAMGKEHGIFGLLYNVALEYYNNNGNIELWELNHRSVKIYDDKYIRMWDKISFGSLALDNIIGFQMRIIRDEEVVKIFTKKDIQRDIDEEEEEENIIKITDLQSEDIVEYFFIRKYDRIRELGSITLQDYFPKKEIGFTLIMPQHLKPFIKVYNKEVEITDTVIESKKLRYSTFYTDFLPAVPVESMAFQKKHLAYVEYTLAYNFAKGRMRLNTVTDYINGLSENLQFKEKDFNNKVKKLIISKIKMDKKATVDEQIRTIENYVKGEHLGLSNRSAISVFAYIFEHYNIKYEIVLTCNKTTKVFDKDFDGRNFLDDVLFYFPSIDKFMCPNYYAYRLGLTHPAFAGNMALWLQKITVGKIESFIHEFKPIPSLKKEVTADSLKLDVEINPVEKNITGKLYRSISGYNCNGIQANFAFYDLEDIENVVEHYLMLGYNNTNVVNEKFINNSAQDIGLKPLIMTADISSYECIKALPNEITLNVGYLIGKQSELKQEKPRQLPVERIYLSNYYRIINITIPDGYKPTNVESLNIAVYDNDDPAKAKAAFIVNFSQKGNIITLESFEYYDEDYYPVDRFNFIERVINASANFNDAKLILEFVKS